ncbi:hypothetical protein PtB15_2B287 [Puccinia triticina]|nr:hypothetical protein PtB15_2B287 [Puccinia triticina]
MSTKAEISSIQDQAQRPIDVTKRFKSGTQDPKKRSNKGKGTKPVDLLSKKPSVELPPDQPKQSFVENNLDSTSLPIPGKDRPENPPYQQFPSAPAASDATTAGTPTHSGPQDNLIDSAPTPGADPLDLALRASQSPGPNPHLEILPTSAPGDEVQQPTSLAIKTPAFSHPNPHDSSAALSNSLQASPC